MNARPFANVRWSTKNRTSQAMGRATCCNSTNPQRDVTNKTSIDTARANLLEKCGMRNYITSGGLICFNKSENSTWQRRISNHEILAIPSTCNVTKKKQRDASDDCFLSVVSRLHFKKTGRHGWAKQSRYKWEAKRYLLIRMEWCTFCTQQR